MASHPISRLKPPQVSVRKPLELMQEPNLRNEAVTFARKELVKPVNSKLVGSIQTLTNIATSNKKIENQIVPELRKPVMPKTCAPTVKKRVSVRCIGSSIARSQIVKTSNNRGILGVQTKGIKKRPSVKASVLRSGTVPVNRQPKFQSNIVKAVVPVAQSLKRPAPQDNTAASKPKQMKAKIPSWNFKERFGALNEKHTELLQSHKELKAKFADFDEIDSLCKSRGEQIDLLTKKVSELEQLNEHYKVENSDLEYKYDTLKKDHHTLEIKNAVLNDKLQNCEKELERILKKEKNNLNEIDQLKNTINELNNELKENIKNFTERCNNLMSDNCRLTEERQKLDDQRRQLHNTIQDLKGNIRVFCRIRPPIVGEEHDLTCNISVLDDNFLDIRKSRETVSQITGKITEQKGEFTFDRVFPIETTQEEVFEDLAQLVQSALDGYNVCVFAYGQTGSGKTYTMQGGADNITKGMIPRTVDLIFKRIEELQRVGWVYKVHASFLEIYNENIHDLLNIKSNLKYDIFYNEGKGTTVTNLRTQPIESAAELQKYMVMAQKNRATATTNYNEHSSRSHAVTQIYLQGTLAETNLVYNGSINLVDLAGSESAKNTSNERLTETKNINKSLSTLGDVMLALYNKSKHIPYRNSKLTYLLQSSLGGNSKTLMVVNISPFDDCFGESISSLRFASKVKEVKTASKRNKAGMLPPQTPNK